jgi:hypothetical protein
MIALVQLLLIGVWAVPLLLHVRRLFRLATVPIIADRRLYVRNKAQRIWWWLGRDEFWGGLHRDVLRAIEASLMIALIALGF